MSDPNTRNVPIAGTGSGESGWNEQVMETRIASYSPRHPEAAANRETGRYRPGAGLRRSPFLRPFGTVRSACDGLRISTREFSTEQYELGGVVDPYEHDDERSRRAKCRFQTLLADVKADQKLADFKERSREDAAGQDLAPSNRDIGKPFEHHGE